MVEVAELDKAKEAECNANGIVSLPVSDEFLTELSDITKQIRDEWYASAPEDAKKIYDEFLSRLWGGKIDALMNRNKKPGFSKKPVSAGSVSHGFYSRTL